MTITHPPGSYGLLKRAKVFYQVKRYGRREDALRAAVLMHKGVAIYVADE